MKLFFLQTIMLLFATVLLAQKQNFEVVSYAVPKGWQKTQNEGGLQLSATDKKTGAYIIALITKATGSNENASTNFNTDWARLVNASVQVTGEPIMETPMQENGWEVISGAANYTDEGSTGMATLLTATGGGQTVSVLLMTNAKKYQDELLAFVNSLELAKAPSAVTGNGNSSGNKNVSMVGMWVFYNTESSGNYNGFPQLTGGYMRREYVFYNDGTYLFRAKDWLVYVKEILFVYETGTYSINGNQITLTPKNGKGAWWSKATDGKTSGWGKLVRTSADYKMEKASYTFEFLHTSGANESVLLLNASKPTVREGKTGNNSTAQQYRYTSRDIKKSLIDNPPGWKF
ncbi:MAG: hypothetical protein ACK5NK_12515 [Niabella sp.]